MNTDFSSNIDRILNEEFGVCPKDASVKELYHAVSKAAAGKAASAWQTAPGVKTACYFSAEFLMGRMVCSNLLNLGLLEECKEYFQKNGLSWNSFEDVEDDALGNGGLGRLAACFLDSAASQGLPLNGYGIRYRYGLFRQSFENGFQKEAPDDWLSWGDPWSVRKEQDSVFVSMKGQTVRAVPYDMPIIGWGGKTVNTLRLWQAEPVSSFDFEAFNRGNYVKASSERAEAEALSALLYPNDDTREGKKLRLKQQYFFSSASLQSLLRDYVREKGRGFRGFSDSYAIQLNDTHPVVSIPEFLRILCGEYFVPFEEAFEIAAKTFSYTNHTIMAEALEKWDTELFCEVLPEVYPYVVMLHNRLCREMLSLEISEEKKKAFPIIQNGQIHMARMAVYASHATNGVAEIHTEILKNSVLKEWYELFPERFQNKTNGITQRRWLRLCNPELSDFITRRIGDGWITNLEELKKLIPYGENPADLKELGELKLEKKRQLCAYVSARENFNLFPEFIFDVQVKRLHEYKRQLLNAFSILDLYFGIKDGKYQDFYPTAFLFGAKAAPGYRRAKGIIKFINEIANLVNYDPAVNRKMQVVFLKDYNVSYAEKIIPAADFSEQISTAGTEASGTGNMKLMLNGALTVGTMDGANIEIVREAGKENNYIFGASAEEIETLKDSYCPKEIYKKNQRIRRVLDTLIDGTFSDGGSGVFRELYDSILEGASWHRPDQYYLLLDFESYCEARLKANREYGNRQEFLKKSLMNIANAGKFSSDRTIRQYAEEIWGICSAESIL